RRDSLDDPRIRRARVDQRAAERLEEHAALEPPDAVLGDLARAAGRDVLVALATRLRVVDGSETVRASLDLLEDEAIIVERSERHDRVLFERVEVRPLVEIAVREAVEARRRFGETPRGWSLR